MTTIVGNGITLYRWMVVANTIKMAMDGLVSQQFKLKKSKICVELGLKPRAKLPVMLAAVELKIESIKSTLKPGDITP